MGLTATWVFADRHAGGVLTDGQRDTLPIDGVAYALFAGLGITEFPGN